MVTSACFTWETRAAFGCPLTSRCLTHSLVPQHKKLAEGSAYEELPTSVMYSENDISNSIKNGILYLEDPINHVRVRHHCPRLCK